MTWTQQKILMRAPKYRRFTTLPGRREFKIIPDTPKALEWAIRQHGATHLSTLSFHRLNLDGKTVPYQWGDFYCRWMDGASDRGASRLHDVLCLIMLRRLPQIDPSEIRVTLLGKQQIGITFPAAFFHLTQGAAWLRQYYKLFADTLRNWVAELGCTNLIVQHDDFIDIPNRRVGDMGYAVSMSMAEYLSTEECKLPQLMRLPREQPVLRCVSVIDSDIGSELQSTAFHLMKQQQGRNQTGWSETKPLLNPFGGSNYPPTSIKCALSLIKWCHLHRLVEFSRRDALRAVDGTFTLNNGVADALRILQTHNHILECPVPDIRCGGRHPLWYLVNPSIFRDGRPDLIPT